MKYNVVLGITFKKEFKKLNKKHKSLSSDLLELISKLEVNPNKGIHAD